MVKTSKEFPGIKWVEKTRVFIKINEQKCTGCANCVKVCLAGCFEMVDRKVNANNML